MTSAGELRDRVGFYLRETFEDSSPLPDYGNTQGEFPAEPEFTVAAKIQPKLGGESVLAGRLAGTNLVNVTVRQSAATSTVTTDWRAKNERTGELYNVRSIIDPDQGTAQHGRWFEILAEVGVAS